MKRVVVLLLAVLCVSSVSADERSDKVLSKMAAKISSLGDYKVSVVIDAESRAAGEFTVSGDRYYMDFFDAMDLGIVCDGKIKYEINSSYEEVTVSNVNLNDKSFLSSPSTVFLFANDSFTHKYIGTQSINGILCDVISLEYIKKTSESNNITLAVGVQSELPVKITYSTQSIEDGVKINIQKFESVGRAPEALFQFHPKDYADYEVIDFR